MPANTPALQLPYPVPDDTTDVPRDIKALAEKLDALVTSPAPVSSLPGAPVDGQEVYYRAGVGQLWHLKYDASVGDAYKWVVVGAPMLADRIDGSGTTTAAWGDLAAGGVGPQVSLPLQGEYVFTWGFAHLYTTYPPAIDFYMGIRCGSADPPAGTGLRAKAVQNAETAFGPAKSVKLPVTGTPPIVCKCVYMHVGNWVTTLGRWLTVAPARVG